jgi:hypothetical protein
MAIEMLNSRESTKIVLLVILGAVILFTIIIPIFNSMCNGDMDKIHENLEDISGTRKIDLNVCSPQCCKFTQWPLPKALQPTGPITEEQLKNVIPNNFSCGWGNGNGCPCITTDDFNYLRDHGGNSMNKDKCN